MITYMTHDHEAIKTCQMQPRNKTCPSKERPPVPIETREISLSGQTQRLYRWEFLRPIFYKVNEVTIKRKIGCKDITSFTSAKSLAAVHTTGGNGR